MLATRYKFRFDLAYSDGKNVALLGVKRQKITVLQLSLTVCAMRTQCGDREFGLYLWSYGVFLLLGRTRNWFWMDLHSMPTLGKTDIPSSDANTTFEQLEDKKHEKIVLFAQRHLH